MSRKRRDSDAEILASAILASPIGPGVSRRLRSADAAVRERRVTPACGMRRAAGITVAASRLLAGRPARGLS
jgi:hypothetical protein